MDFSFIIEVGESKLRITGSAGDTATLWYWSEDKNTWQIISGGVKLNEMRTLSMSVNMSLDALLKHECEDESGCDACDEGN